MEMINAKELRQGNLVYDPYGNEREVTGVMGNYVTVTGATHSTYSCEELSPIELTPEWLERAGFVMPEPNEWYNLIDEYGGGYQYDMEHEEFSQSLQNDFGWMQRLANIKYLHQLQNLYFALTGSELEIAGKGI